MLLLHVFARLVYCEVVLSVNGEASGSFASLDAALLNKVAYEIHIISGTISYNDLAAFKTKYQLLRKLVIDEPVVIQDTLIDSCFSNYNSLEDISISTNTIIPASCFESCISLTSINFPNVQNLYPKCFANCESLFIIKLPKVVNMFASDTDSTSNQFLNCISLDEITFPTLVNMHGTSCFEGCISLTSFSAELLSSIAIKSFFNCSLLSTINISSCTLIGNEAFSGCICLSQINGPNIETINSYSFYYCLKIGRAHV